MSGRPKKADEERIDMQSEAMLTLYESGGLSVRQIAAKYRIGHSACQRRIQRARKNREQYRKTSEGQSEEIVRLRHENAQLRDALERIRGIVQ